MTLLSTMMVQHILFVDVAEKVLDRCTEGKKYTYEFLEDFKPMSWPCFKRCKKGDTESGSQGGNDYWGPKNFTRSNHPLAIMVSCDVCVLANGLQKVDSKIVQDS